MFWFEKRIKNKVDEPPEYVAHECEKMLCDYIPKIKAISSVKFWGIKTRTKLNPFTALLPVV